MQTAMMRQWKQRAAATCENAVEAIVEVFNDSTSKKGEMREDW
jgi:hypothetical protein